MKSFTKDVFDAHDFAETPDCDDMRYAPVRFPLEVDEALYAEILQKAADEGTTVQNVILEAVYRYVMSHKQHTRRDGWGS